MIWDFGTGEENSLDENYSKNEQNSDRLSESNKPSVEKNKNVNANNNRKEDLSKKKMQENFKNMFDEEA